MTVPEAPPDWLAEDKPPLPANFESEFERDPRIRFQTKGHLPIRRSGHSIIPGSHTAKHLFAPRTQLISLLFCSSLTFSGQTVTNVLLLVGQYAYNYHYNTLPLT